MVGYSRRWYSLVGFLNFLKKSKPASASSPDDAGLSIPPPPPFPETAASQRDLPPSYSTDLPDFRPFGQDFEHPPLGLPEVPQAQAPPEFRPPVPNLPEMQPGGMENKQYPDFEPQQDFVMEQPQEPQYIEEPLSEPKDEENETPEPPLGLDVEPPALPKVVPPLRMAEPHQEGPSVRIQHGIVFMKAPQVADLNHDLSAASDGLHKMTVKIKHVEEQERLTEEWRVQLEGLYRKLIVAEKTIFAGEQ